MLYVFGLGIFELTLCDNVMFKHMHHIVTVENRPFSYRDFLSFIVDDTEYSLEHGTIRNKFLQFKKEGKIELDYTSGIAFYTLKGKRFGKSSMTSYHTSGNPFNYKQNFLYNILKDIPLEKNAVHDIRLRLTVNGIWKLFANDLQDTNNPSFHINYQSRDISLPTEKIDELLIRTVIHKTDIVSVIVGCSLRPVILDIPGIIKFSIALTRLEERLNVLVNERLNSDLQLNNCQTLFIKKRDKLIPDFRTWTITMWHFGRDALLSFTGEKFCIELQDGLGVLTRIYTKQFNSKDTKIRIERQEYPKTSLSEAIDQKLSNNIFNPFTFSKNTD